MPEIDGALLLLRIARALDLLSALAIFGTLSFALLVTPPNVRPALADRFARLLRWSLVANLIGAALWLWTQAAAIIDAVSATEVVANLWLVASSTRFGTALLARTAGLLLAVGVAANLRSSRRTAIATLIAAIALGLQSQLGHAAAAEGPALPLAAGFHVLAAGAWLGGLIPLALAIRSLPTVLAGKALRRFSWVGIGAVLILVGSAWLQANRSIGNLGGWFGTPYGMTALLKIAGLVVLLAFAAINRQILTPRLAGRSSRSARRALAISIALETIIGVAVVIVAVTLATLPPAAHEAPVWPFPQRPDLSKWDDPYIAVHIWRSLAIAGTLLAGVLALLWRRTRLIGPLLAGIALFALPLPNLRLLAKPAHPTSYQRSATDYTVEAIARGLDLLRRHCTADCFRPKDDPSDLTPYGVWQRPDGDFFWWLTDVFDRIGHSPFAYGTIAGLEPRQRWQLIDYFRARVSGAAVEETGAWPYPVLAPQFQAACDGRTTGLDALRGRLVHLAFRGDGRTRDLPALPAGVDAITVLLVRDAPGVPGPTCSTNLPDAWSAYAIAAGLDEDRLDGIDLLIDANGWLRLRRLPGASGWETAAADIVRAPFPASAVGTHGH